MAKEFVFRVNLNLEESKGIQTFKSFYASVSSSDIKDILEKRFPSKDIESIVFIGETEE